MKVADEEVFGPVVAIEAYDDFDSVLSRANESSLACKRGFSRAT